jgi:hypothetical protein
LGMSSNFQMSLHMGTMCEACGRVHFVATSPGIGLSQTTEVFYRLTCKPPCSGRQRIQKRWNASVPRRRRCVQQRICGGGRIRIGPSRVNADKAGRGCVHLRVKIMGPPQRAGQRGLHHLRSTRDDCPPHTDGELASPAEGGRAKRICGRARANSR